MPFRRRAGLDLAAAIGRVAASDARLLVVTGADRTFCAGADLDDFAAMRGDEAAVASFRADMRAALDSLRGLAVPTIALIEGHCFGAGVALAMACDIRIAAPDARFAITPAKIGISYPQEDVHRLVALVGPGQAARILFTAETIDGEEAKAIGLVDAHMPREKALFEAMLANDRGEPGDAEGGDRARGPGRAQRSGDGCALRRACSPARPPRSGSKRCGGNDKDRAHANAPACAARPARRLRRSGRPARVPDQRRRRAAAGRTRQPDRVPARRRVPRSSGSARSSAADSRAGRMLTIRKPDGGFRRLLVGRDGRISAADGAEPARCDAARRDRDRGRDWRRPLPPARRHAMTRTDHPDGGGDARRRGGRHCGRDAGRGTDGAGREGGRRGDLALRRAAADPGAVRAGQ